MNNDISEKLILQIHYCTNLMHREQYMHRFEPAENVGQGQGQVLRVLMEEDGLTLKDLSSRLQIRPASVGELVDKLEINGYVERRINENDKRILNVFITDKGRALAEEAMGARAEAMDTVFSGLTEEEKLQLSELLEKLITSMAERHTDFDRFDRRGHFGHGPMGGEGGDDFRRRPGRFHHGPYDLRDGGGDWRGPGRRF